MIEVLHAVKRFGDQIVLNGVSCSIASGERVLFLGQNGAGKTTLLRCILGEYRLNAGAVRINGFDPVTEREKALSSVAFIPQLPPPLPMTVAHLFEYANQTGGGDIEQMMEYCRLFDLSAEEFLGKPFSKLSGGMKQKVLASIAFARKAPVMLFDEPTANLDPKARKVFSNLLHSDSLKGTTMVFISHRVEELNTMIDRAVWLDHGKVVKDEKLH
jgi:ABC-2 type transport system ATP-binding protein